MLLTGHICVFLNNMKLALVNSIKGQINSVSATHASYLQSFSKTFMCILNKMTANFYSVTVLAGCWGRGF